MSSFKTIKSYIETDLKEKGSLFTGKAFPVKQPSDAEKILHEIRKEFYDATHHCYAYRFFSGEEKYSDDGEPSGSAGVRILNAIDHFEYYSVLVIVIRYFGGVKLGVGPLGKAYYQSALMTLEKAAPLIKKEYFEGKIIYNFDETSTAHNILNNYNAVITETDFDNKPFIKYLIESDKADEFLEECNSFNPNKIHCKLTDKVVLL